MQVNVFLHKIGRLMYMYIHIYLYIYIHIASNSAALGCRDQGLGVRVVFQVLGLGLG